MTRYRMMVQYSDGTPVLPAPRKPKTHTTRAAAEQERDAWAAHVAPLNRFRKAQGKPEYVHVVEEV